MRTKAPMPPQPPADEPVPAELRGYLQLVHLKQLYRQGWLHRGVPADRCESVAEHSFGTAVLALWLAGARDDGLDADRVLRMALLHDLGEAHAGDLTPADGVDGADKQRRERDGVRRIVGSLPGGEGLQALWEEYEAQRTPEARFVRQLDRLEMALQAWSYERQGLGELGEFQRSAAATIDDPALRALLDEVARLRGQGG